ncbi:MAG: ribonuclease HI family protein [bacterium]|nr:ribonuclease HI family protein [bacterium]
MKEITAYIDGASKGNPGKASIGIVIYSEGVLLKKISASIGEATNNIAEYTALITALIECLQYKPEKLEIRSDSQILIRQMQGSYRVRDKYLQKLYFIATHLIALYNNVSFIHIPREENKEADKVAQNSLQDNI